MKFVSVALLCFVSISCGGNGGDTVDSASAVLMNDAPGTQTTTVNGQQIVTTQDLAEPQSIATPTPTATDRFTYGIFEYCKDDPDRSGSTGYQMYLSEYYITTYFVYNWSGPGCTGTETNILFYGGRFQEAGSAVNSEGVEVIKIDYMHSNFFGVWLPEENVITEYGSVFFVDDVLYMANGGSPSDYVAPSQAERYMRVDFSRPYIRQY